MQGTSLFMNAGHQLIHKSKAPA